MPFLSRRHLVQSLGLGAGAALLSPFLRQVQAGESTPRRFVLVVEGNGIYPYSFLSTQARKMIDAQAKQPIGEERLCYLRYGHTDPITVMGDVLTTAKCLDPLGGAGDDDLTKRAAVVLGLSSTITGGGHSTGFGALSCARAVNSPATATIDTVLADLVQGPAPFDVLRVGIHGDIEATLAYETCAFGPDRAAPVVVNPTVAYNLLFGSVSDAAGQKSFARQKSLLDYAQQDINRTLKAFGGSSAERKKLENYLASVTSLQARHDKLVAAKGALQAVKPESPGTNPLYAQNPIPDNFQCLKWLEAQFELVTAALLGGLTNVAVVASGTGLGGFAVRDSSIHPQHRHDIQHGMLPGKNPDAAALAKAAAYVETVATMTRRHVQLIANLARKLAATPEVGASGSMLDHTVIVYLSDNGEQHHSLAEEWPMLLVGGNALGFKTDGRTVVYPAVGQPKNRLVSNLFNSLLNATGGQAPGGDPKETDKLLNQFGLEGPSAVKGPLGELWAKV